MSLQAIDSFRSGIYTKKVWQSRAKYSDEGIEMDAALHIRMDELTPDFVVKFRDSHKDKSFVVVPEADYQAMLKAKRNAEYLAMLDKSFQELEEGKVVVKTMEELEAMANG